MSDSRDLTDAIVALSNAIRILADQMERPLTARQSVREELDKALEAIRRAEENR